MSKRFACLFSAQQKLSLGFAEACYQFTPQIALREPNAIFLEVGGSLSLFSEDSLQQKIRELAPQFGCSVRVAFADDVPTSLSLARFQCRDEGELPLEAIHDFAETFGENPDARKKTDHAVEAFRKLGLTKLKEIQALPPESFSSRFGKEVALAITLMRNRHALAWPAFIPSEVISEEISTEDAETLSACFDSSGIFPLLSIQLDRVVARMQARCLRASRLEVEFTLDDKSKVNWDIPLAFPQGSAVSLMRILQERIHSEISLHPLSAPLVSSRLSIPETVLATGGQQDFFDRKEEQEESMGALFEVLAAKLGKNQVFYAELRDCYLPEKAWKATQTPVPFESDGTVILPPARPSRLLADPMLIRRERDELICMRLQRRWKISGWQGPERLTEEWWSDSPRRDLQRDYYQVQSTAGEKLWIFESAGSLFLHGYFD